MKAMTVDQNKLVETLKARFPGATQFRVGQARDLAKEIGIKPGTAHSFVTSFPKAAHGIYDLSEVMVSKAADTVVAEAAPAIETKETDTTMNMQATQDLAALNQEVYIPTKLGTYVKWGFYKDVKKILQSKMFFPTFISGLSGNGKTIMVEQACAELKREYVRVQITPETDEDDLIGGFRLINGQTIFEKGPVIKAMEAGAVLLIDEIDRGSNKLMALQGVLEGNPVLLKKTGEVVRPAPGFNVIATANTKGQGSDDGKFIAATVIDEAFLERFTITMEQPYPTEATERKIVVKHMENHGAVDEGFAETLVKWSKAIRTTFQDGGVEDVISTRRLCHIVQTFAIFGDYKRSVELCVSRFDEDTREAFIQLFDKISVDQETADKADTQSAQKETSTKDALDDIFASF